VLTAALMLAFWNLILKTAQGKIIAVQSIFSAATGQSCANAITIAQYLRL
jgi:hypothetical protein